MRRKEHDANRPPWEISAPTTVQSWGFSLERWRGDWTLGDLPWRWIGFIAAGVVAVAPLALSAVYDDLPPVIFAATPMVIYVGIWMVFRGLDGPGAAPGRRPPRGPPRPPAPRPRAPGSSRSKARGATTRRAVAEQ